MAGFSKMVDMRSTATELEADSEPDKLIPWYGGCICLNKDQIEKLGLDVTDCAVGDLLHGEFMAELRSISKDRLELEFTHLGVEDEDDEGDEKRKRRYGDEGSEAA